MQLTTEQIEEFQTRGVLIAKNALTHEDLHPVIDEICEFIDRRALELKEEGKIEDLCENEPFETRYGRLFAQSREIGNGLDIMNYRGKAVFDFLHNKNLLDVIGSLIGPEIVCNPIQHLRPTPPIRYYEDSNPASHIGPLHQDAGCHYAGSGRLGHHHLLAAIGRCDRGDGMSGSLARCGRQKDICGIDPKVELPSIRKTYQRLNLCQWSATGAIWY